MTPFLAQLTLDPLCSLEYLAGSETGLTQDDTIEEVILGLKAPWLRLYQRRLSDNLSYPFTDEFHGPSQIFCPVTEVTSQSKKHLM